MTFCFSIDYTHPNAFDQGVEKFEAYEGCGSTPLSAAVWNSVYRPIWGLGLGTLIVLCDQKRYYYEPKKRPLKGECPLKEESHEREN